jgi:hypothetical protein
MPETAAPGEVARGFDPGSILAMQRSAGNAAVSGLLPNAAHADHSLARALARTAQERTGREPVPQASPARLLRSRLRTRALARVSTSGGDWSTDKHDATKDLDSAGNKAPAADGWRGVDIDLKFKPNATVDAELIGLTQTAQSIEAGAPLILPAAASHDIPAGDAKPLNTGAGETDESAHIDQSSTNPNPLYAVENAKSTKLTDPAQAFFGQHGFHFKNGIGAVQKQDGILKDTPRLPHADKNSRQIFETTALATKGAQAGTYYGSVRWGWRTDSAGAFTKVDLATVSEGVPSSTFLKAGAIWNASKTPGGNKDTVDLPLPDVHVTTGPVTLKPPIPMIDIPLLVGTRLQIITPALGPSGDGTVKIVDGPHTGITGDVSASEWINIQDERA